MSYGVNRAWSDKFEREIKRIIGEEFLVNDFQKDTKENTDLLVFEAHRMNVACRVRKHKFWKLYPKDITIRWRSKSGANTEIDKLIDGYGDYMFYGFADESNERILAYRIIDLNKLRAVFIRQPDIIHTSPRVKKNPDGTELLALNVDLIKGAIPINRILIHDKSDAA